MCVTVTWIDKLNEIGKFDSPNVVNVLCVLYTLLLFCKCLYGIKNINEGLVAEGIS